MSTEGLLTGWLVNDISSRGNLRDRRESNPKLCLKHTRWATITSVGLGSRLRSCFLFIWSSIPSPSEASFAIVNRLVPVTRVIFRGVVIRIQAPPEV